MRLSSLGSPKALTKDRSRWVCTVQAELRSDLCRQLLKDTNLTELKGSDIWKHLGAQVVLSFFNITFIRLKWKVQALVMEHSPLARGTERIQPNKNNTPGLSRSVAQTSCQPFYKGMHFPPNNFPQMDNPSKVSGSFPPDLNCSWKQEFPACSPRPRQAHVWGCPSFQSSSSRAGPISVQGICNRPPRAASWAAAARRELWLRVLTQRQHIHLAQQSAANSHYKLLSNYSPLPIYIWEANKVRSQ